MVRKRVFAVIALATVGCVQEDVPDNAKDKEEPVGGGYAQCLNHTSGIGDGASEVAIAIDRLVPSTAEVQCTDEKAFSFEDREVHFVYVAYGALQDCPSGCFSSYVCAIYDPDEAQLYSASWYGAGERPLSISSDCAELASSESGHTTTGCSSQPSGFRHPVTQSQAFQAFRTGQIEESGDWRFCFF